MYLYVGALFRDINRISMKSRSLKFQTPNRSSKLKQNSPNAQLEMLMMPPLHLISFEASL